MTTTDAGWLDALYRNSSIDLLAFLRRRYRTPEDAADCLAETYLVAWRKQAERPTEAELRPWLFGIARNLALRGHQHNGRLATATKALAEGLSAAATTTSDEATDATHGHCTTHSRSCPISTERSSR
jgi:RNA polymerase sigma-70 factor (ECF subfamily)